MSLPRAVVLFKKLVLEQSPDSHRALAAAAYKPDTASGQALDSRDAHLFLETAGDDLPLVGRQKYRPAHDGRFRLAAASASRAFE